MTEVQPVELIYHHGTELTVLLVLLAALLVAIIGAIFGIEDVKRR